MKSIMPKLEHDFILAPRASIDGYFNRFVKELFQNLITQNLENSSSLLSNILARRLFVPRIWATPNKQVRALVVGIKVVPRECP